MPRYKIVNTIFLACIIFLVVVDWLRGIDASVYVLLITGFVFIQLYGALYMSAGFFLPSICSGKKESNSIALTFDDGPVSGQTEKVLDILSAYQLKACFFCIGDRVNKNPDLMKRLGDEGHIIGNHSYFHRWNFDLLASSKMKEELERTDEAISGIMGVRPNYFRPPYGVTNPNLAVAVGKDYHVVGWSVRSFDTVIKDPVKLLNRVTRQIKGGDIILFHDHSETMHQILPDFIKHVESIGLKIVRLDKLIGESPYTTSA